MDKTRNQIVFSIIIPCFNEENAIKGVIKNLSETLKQEELAENTEIIIIDDGSTDKSLAEAGPLAGDNIIVKAHPYNKGYGASIKTGAVLAKGEYLIFYDADGQHNPASIKELIGHKDNYEMVIGSREKYNGPSWRKPGKKVLNLIANYLVDFKIPDLNSGLRLVRKGCFEKFVHLYPSGFSLSTTITLAFIKHGYNVKYIPINVNIRVGKSSLKLKDGFKAINLVFRMIMLFSPIKIFFPCFLLFMSLCAASLYIDLFIYGFNLSESTLILFITSLLFLFIGLIADQIAAIRRELKF